MNTSKEDLLLNIEFLMKDIINDVDQLKETLVKRESLFDKLIKLLANQLKNKNHYAFDDKIIELDPRIKNKLDKFDELIVNVITFNNEEKQFTLTNPRFHRNQQNGKLYVNNKLNNLLYPIDLADETLPPSNRKHL